MLLFLYKKFKIHSIGSHCLIMIIIFYRCVLAKENLNMELNVENMQALSKYLQQTLSPEATERRAAEKYLEYVEGNKNYALLLLMLVDNTDAEMHIRVSAAITFKNFVKRNWRVVSRLLSGWRYSFVLL